MTDAEAERAIRDNLLDYCEFLDEKRIDDFIGVFTEDVVFEEAGETVGRAALRKKVLKLLKVFDRLSHHLSNIRITRTGPDTARSTAYIYAYQKLAKSGEILEIWGRYVSEHRLEDDRWRISKRTVLQQGWRGGFDRLDILEVPVAALPDA